MGEAAPPQMAHQGIGTIVWTVTRLAVVDNDTAVSRYSGVTNGQKDIAANDFRHFQLTRHLWRTNRRKQIGRTKAEAIPARVEAVFAYGPNETFGTAAAHRERPPSGQVQVRRKIFGRHRVEAGKIGQHKIARAAFFKPASDQPIDDATRHRRRSCDADAIWFGCPDPTDLLADANDICFLSVLDAVHRPRMV